MAMCSRFAGKKCPMCSFEAATVRIVLSHLRIVHSHDPRFNVTCGVDGCTRTFRSFSALYSHIYRQHKSSGIIQSERIDPRSSSTEPFEALSLHRAHVDPPTEALNLDDLDGKSEPCSDFINHQIYDYLIDVTQADMEYLLGNREQVQRNSALFLIKLKEQRRVSQVTIDDIVSGLEGLLQQTVSRAKAGIRAKLSQQGVSPADLVGLDDVFDDIVRPFDGLETAFKQEKYFKECLGLVVSIMHNV